MFDALSNRLQDVFQSLKGETRLTEATVERVLGEIRLALLEADVNFKVVKAFVRFNGVETFILERIRAKLVGESDAAAFLIQIQQHPASGA